MRLDSNGGRAVVGCSATESMSLQGGKGLCRQSINGVTRPIALLGDPVEHSLSPLIHNHLFATLGLPYVYIPLRVERGHIAAVITALRFCGFAGANITVPHKAAVLPFCDVLSDISEITGAVNTLYVRNGLVYGTTTDPEGFFAALTAIDVDVAAQHVVIIGNGGIARTLAFALALHRRPLTLTLAARNGARAGALAAEVTQVTGFTVRVTVLVDSAIEETMRQCTLLVNCTSVGMYPHCDQSPMPSTFLHAGMTVFDTVYNPPITRLIAQARQAGARAENGLRMLIEQGLASFELWTGTRPASNLIDRDRLLALLNRPLP